MYFPQDTSLWSKFFKLLKPAQITKNTETIAIKGWKLKNWLFSEIKVLFGSINNWRDTAAMICSIDQTDTWL